MTTSYKMCFYKLCIVVKGGELQFSCMKGQKRPKRFDQQFTPNAKQSTRKWDMIERLFKFLLLSVASIFKKIYGIKFKVTPVTIELSNERMEMKTARNLLTAGHQGSGYIISFFRWLKEWFFSYRWHTQKRVLKLLHRYVSCLWR